MVMFVYFIDSIYYSAFYLFLFWLLKPEYFLFKIQDRIPSKVEVLLFMMFALSIINALSNLMWLRIDYGFTILDWENGEHYFSFLGYLAIFYLTYWLVFERGSLQVTPKV